MCFFSKNTKLLMINNQYLYQVNFNKYKTLVDMQIFAIKDLYYGHIFNITSIASKDLFGFINVTENDISTLFILNTQNFDVNAIQQPQTFVLKEKVNYCVFSKDNYLALLYNFRVEIWDYSYTNMLRQIDIQHDEQLKTAQFSSDEKQIAIMSKKLFWIYNFNDPAEILFTNNKDSVQVNTILFESDVQYYSINSIAFSNNNNYLALCFTHQVYLFSTEKFILAKKIDWNQDYLKEVKFSTDYSLLFLIGEKSLILYQIQQEKFTISKYQAYQILIGLTQLKKDNNTLLLFFDQHVTICSLISDDQTLKLKLEYLKMVEFQYFKYCYLENQNAFVLISRTDDKFFFYQYKQKDNDQFNILGCQQNDIKDICISNDEDMIASAGEQESLLWKKSNDNYKQIAQLPGGKSVVFFENDNYLAINQEDLVIKILSLKNRQNIVQDFEYPFNLPPFRLNLQIVNDKLFLIYFYLFSYEYFKGAVIYFDQIKKCFQIEGITEFIFQSLSYNYFNTILVNPQNFEIIQIHQSYINIENKINQYFVKRRKIQSIKDFVYEINKYYILASYDQIVFLNSEGNIIYQFKYHGYDIKNIQFIYSTRHLVIGQVKGNITILNCEKINLENESENQVVPPCYHQFQSNKKLTAMVISNQYQIIISAHDNYLYFWDIRSKQKILSFSAHQQQITSILIFKDGKYFVTGSKDKTFKIWDLEAIQQVQDDEAHYDSLEKIKYESFNEVISLGLDNALCIWNAKQKQFVKKINNIKNFVHFKDQFLVCDNSDKIYYLKNKKNDNNNLQYLELLNSNQIKVLNWEDFIGLEDKLFHYFITNKLSYKYFLNPQIYNIIQSNEPKGKAKASTLNLENFSIFLKYQDTLPFLSTNYIFQFEIYEMNQAQNKSQLQSQFSVTLEKDQIKKIFFFTDKIFFISNYDKFLFVQELQNLQQSKFQKLEGHQKIIQDMIYSKPYIITQDSICNIIFWNIIDYSKQNLIIEKILEDLNIEKSELFMIGVSQQQQYLATQHLNGFIYVWTIQDFKKWNIKDFKKLKLESELTLVTHRENKAKQIEFSPNGNILACLYEDFIWFYNISNKNLSGKIVRSTYQLSSFFCFHPKLPEIILEKNGLFSFHMNQAFDYQELKIFHELRDIKFSNDQNLLASSITNRYRLDEKRLKIYNFQDSKIINNIELEQSKFRGEDCQMNFSLFNQFFYSLFRNLNTLIIWYSVNNSIYLELENIVSAEFTNDEKAIFVATENYDLQIISLESKQIIQRMKNFQHSIKSICLSPNNSLFFLGLNDGTLLLYAFSKEAVKNPQQNLQHQQDYSIKPFCYKSFSRYSQLLANGCILNERSIIETQNKQSLIQTFLQKEAILDQEQFDGKKQQEIKLDKKQIKSDIDQQKK